MPRSRITVRPSRRRPIFGQFTAARAWSIWLLGDRLPGWYVVDGQSPNPFRTVIRNGEMVTSWHLGIGPGDLARLVVARYDAEAAR